MASISEFLGISYYEMVTTRTVGVERSEEFDHFVADKERTVFTRNGERISLDFQTPQSELTLSVHIDPLEVHDKMLPGWERFPNSSHSYFTSIERMRVCTLDTQRFLTVLQALGIQLIHNRRTIEG